MEEVCFLRSAKEVVDENPRGEWFLFKRAALLEMPRERAAFD